MNMERRRKLNINWDLYCSALIVEVFRNGNPYTSTAVAINRKILITAAHSVVGFESASIYIGESYRDYDERFKVKDCVIHPDYDREKSLFQNDLALIVLEEELPELCKFEPISKTNSLKSGDLVDRVGFGSRNERNKRTWTNPTYKSRTEDMKNLILEDGHSVIGDSGGPIFKTVDGGVELVGIHSTLEGTSKTYVANLPFYLDWIEDTIQKYC